MYRRGPDRFDGLVTSDRDLLFPHATFEQWARCLGGAPVVRIPGRAAETGHLLIVQEPAVIAAQISALADNSKPDAGQPDAGRKQEG